MPFDVTPPNLTEVIDARLVLERAAQLVTRGWCRCSLARRNWLIPVVVTSPAARRFCASGAIFRAAHDLGISEHRASMLLRRVAEEAGYDSIIDWNDRSTTRTRVVVGMRRAMEM
jgi:hypothetical protein